MTRLLMALACLIAIMPNHSHAATPRPAAVKPANRALEVKGVLKHRHNRLPSISLVRPKVLTRIGALPVYVGSGPFAAESVSQIVCSMYHPGLTAVSFGVSETLATSVKLGEGGRPLAAFRPNANPSSHVGLEMNAAPVVLSHVTCVAHN